MRSVPIPNIDVRLETELSDVQGFVGNFHSTLNSKGSEEVLEHGIAILATGARELKPQEYLYGQDPRVLTHTELDRRFIAGDPELKNIRTAVFIQCVGSREPERPYCSRVCCTHSIESALHLRELNPDMNIYVLYRDIRTYGEREHLYRKARSEGILFIHYSKERKPVVTAGPGGLSVETYDRNLGQTVRIRADLLSLASAIVPYGDERVAQQFKVPMNQDGFFVEAHAKLGPSEFATDGVFLCGMAHYPKPIDESIAQSQAAVSRAVTLLARKRVQVAGTVACRDSPVVQQLRHLRGSLPLLGPKLSKGRPVRRPCAGERRPVQGVRALCGLMPVRGLEPEGVRRAADHGHDRRDVSRC